MSDPGRLLRIVGRYAIYDKIASGGMATVHLGRLLGPVGFARTVAVKCMRSELAEDPDFVSMFLDEARLAARIHHPNVVSVLDVVAEAGELFLVMDYVKGESLARMLHAARERAAALPPEMAVTLMAGVLHGLHAAHEARGERGEQLGIVHRDMSPQNVLCGIDGVARVVDFGVAKAAGRIQTTREGQLKGKIAYMAPEQLRGSVTRATDVYAASVVLWEALCGKRLFTGESGPEVIAKVMAGNVQPPSAVAPHVPPSLDAIVLRGLEADPAQRWATAYEMARALEDALPPVAASRIGEWVREVAEDVLAQREKIVEVVESDSAVMPPVPPPAKPARRGDARRPPPAVAGREGTAGVTEDMVLTQLSSGSISAPGAAEGERRHRTRKLGLAGGVGALLIVLLAGGFALRRGPTHQAAPAGASAAAASAPSAVPSVAASPSASQASDAASASASASAAPPASSDAASAPAPPPPRRAPRPARPAAPTKRSVYDHI